MQVYISRFAVKCQYNMMRVGCVVFADATPFLQKVQEILFSQILKMPDTFSVTALLDTWVRDWYRLGYTHGILLQNITTGLGTIFQQQKIPRDLDPPTHFHSNLGFLGKNSLQNPPYVVSFANIVLQSHILWGVPNTSAFSLPSYGPLFNPIKAIR